MALVLTGSHLVLPLLGRLEAEAHVLRTTDDHLAHLGEVEHDGADGRLGGRAARGEVREEVAEGHEADEAGACGVADRELVEALFSHGFDCFAAGRGAGDGGHRF